MKPTKETTRPFMLRRDKRGNYVLRVRIRRAPHLTEVFDRALSTHDGAEAWFRARLLLRLLADLGLLAGWSGEKFMREDARENLPRKNPCHAAPHRLKQREFPFTDA